SSQENNSQKSTEKEREVWFVKQQKRRKILKSLPQSDAISRIVSASESCSTIMSTFLVPNTSIGEVMAEIQKIETITSDPNFYSRCCQLMIFKPAKKMF
ncbi:hypothetical protein S83_038864, partial [Arachis hypogaea]